MKENKLCIVCNKNKGKYRCTKCPERYCSKECYKIHECKIEKKDEEND